MTNTDNQQESDEQQFVRLTRPVVLNSALLKAAMTKDILSNNPEYVSDIAQRYNLDPQQDQASIADKLYEEQIDTITEICIANTLDENIVAAYELLQNVCYFSPEDIHYMQMTEGENLPSNVTQYINERLSGVSELMPVVDFTNTVNEAILYSTNDCPDFTLYKANQLKEKFDECNLKLTNEQKGKLSFIASKMYRKLSQQNVFMQDNGRAVDFHEKECLHKTLSLTSDYKLISHCQNRLQDAKDEQDIISAYQYALSKKQSRNDLYKINVALSSLYIDKAQTIGFFNDRSVKKISADRAKKHLLNAYRYAHKEDRPPLLNKLAKIHMTLGEIQEWKNIKEVLAMKFQKGEDRCHTLNSIADKTGDCDFYRKALEECKRARMPQADKIHIQETTYEKMALKTKDPTVKQEAEQQLAEIRIQKQQIFRQLLNTPKEK